MGLDPRTPEPCPGPKTGAKLLSHPGCPTTDFIDKKKIDPDQQALKMNL